MERIVEKVKKISKGIMKKVDNTFKEVDKISST